MTQYSDTDIELFIERHQNRLLKLCEFTREKADEDGADIDDMSDTDLMKVLIQELDLIAEEAS